MTPASLAKLLELADAAIRGDLSGPGRDYDLAVGVRELVGEAERLSLTINIIPTMPDGTKVATVGDVDALWQEKQRLREALAGLMIIEDYLETELSDKGRAEFADLFAKAKEALR